MGCTKAFSFLISLTTVIVLYRAEGRVSFIRSYRGTVTELQTDFCSTPRTFPFLHERRKPDYQSDSAPKYGP